jgi:hypothetical protein
MAITNEYAAPGVPTQSQPWYAFSNPVCVWSAIAAMAVVAAIFLIYPTLRVFSMVEISYNEGWNVYHAVTAAHHLPLYTQKYGWTTVNYPALSFYLVARLHRAGLSYLAAGRLLASIAFPVSCLLVGLIVRRLNGDYRSAAFSAFFCMVVFCIAGNDYLGYDDPQLLAQALFLCGLLAYISGPPRTWRLVLVTLLFIVGGNIKHIMVEFPLAVLIDLALVRKKWVAQYMALSAALLAISIYANAAAGGPFFIADILTPRTFSPSKAFIQFMQYGFGPVPLAMIAAAWWSKAALKNKRLRVLAILFWLSTAFGVASGGVIGVWVNAYFDIYLTVAMITGLLMHRIWQGEFVGRFKWAAVAAPAALLISLLPVWLFGPPLLRAAIADLPGRRARFQSEVAVMRDHPGSAFCESPLRCYAAGKAFEYDPFNSANLVSLGKLNAAPLIDRLKRGDLAVVQLCCSIDFLKHDDDTFIIPQTLPAIESAYQLIFADEGCYIYAPKKTLAGLASPAAQ